MPHAQPEPVPDPPSLLRFPAGMESVLASSTNPAHAALSFPPNLPSPDPSPGLCRRPPPPASQSQAFYRWGSAQRPSPQRRLPKAEQGPPVPISFPSYPASFPPISGLMVMQSPPPRGGSPLPAQSLPPTPPQGPSPSWWVGETRGQSSKVEAGGNPSRAWGGAFYFMDSWEPWRFYEQGSDESSPRKGPRPPGHHQMVTVMG